jgi:hypothetical protein
MCRSELFTTFGAAAFQDQLPAFSRHASAKPMSLGAAAIIGLKSPLHIYTPLDFYLNRKQ